jgi:putative SOS response-associated peptidase YedK
MPLVLLRDRWGDWLTAEPDAAERLLEPSEALVERPASSGVLRG